MSSPPPRASTSDAASTPDVARTPDAPASTTCVLLARAYDAQAAGTAPVAQGWVLLEQDGAWGRKALTSSGLDPALGAALDEAAGPDVRVQLVRRPASRTPSSWTPASTPAPASASTPPPPSSSRVGSPSAPSAAGRTVVLAHAGATPWAEQLTLDDDALAALDPRLAAAPRPPGLGTPVEGPLWLVCTHGKRDRCCATYGRPIVDALAALHGDAVWETSHVGGHRFAGNLVALPSGEVYGTLQVADALRVVQLHEAGRTELAALRGRSGLPRAAQAAEILARTELDVDRRDAVAITAVEPRPAAAGVGGAGAGGSRTHAGAGEEVAVHLTVEGRHHLAVVVLSPTGVAYPLSCDSDDPEDPGRWELRSLTEVSAG